MILAGVVTLYNPDKDVVGNLLSYASFLALHGNLGDE